MIHCTYAVFVIHDERSEIRMVGSVGGGYNNSALFDSMRKLSSANRIDRAADDPAGLAVSQKMISQKAGIEQTIRNRNDEMAQKKTYETKLGNVSNTLQNIYSNAVAASSGTLSDSDRSTVLNVNSNLLQGVREQMDPDQMKSFGLDNLDVGDPDAVKSAIEGLSKARGAAGAGINADERFINQNEAENENLTSSLSTLADTDMAKEISNFRNKEILTQIQFHMMGVENQQQNQKSNLLDMML